MVEEAAFVALVHNVATNTNQYKLVTNFKAKKSFIPK